jgi:hypothetical protein
MAGGPGGKAESGVLRPAVDSSGRDHSGEPTQQIRLPGSFTPVGYSFQSDEPVNHEGDHQCVTYDPTQPSDPTPIPSSKEELETEVKNHRLNGHFVDHCPTEDVVARCDHRRSRQMMTFYYKGKMQGDLHVLRKVYCENAIFRGVWTWVVPPDPVPKPTPNGTVGLVCDSHQTMLRCQTFRADMDPKKLAEQKAGCSILQGKVTDHCPAEGLTGRCEEPATGITTYHYLPADVADMLWSTCEKQGGKWSAP